MLSPDDICDTKYRAWSRIYEYPVILNAMANIGLTGNASIHNTSCGKEPIHLQFMQTLDRLVYVKVTNSDLYDNVPIVGYTRWDITKQWPWEKFDTVINISTVEHLPKQKRIPAIQNLIDMLKPGGHLLLTFDWPRVSNSEIESFFKAKMKDVPIRLNGENSKRPDVRYKNLNIIYLHAVKP